MRHQGSVHALIYTPVGLECSGTVDLSHEIRRPHHRCAC